MCACVCWRKHRTWSELNRKCPLPTFMGTRQPIKCWDGEEERETKDNACCMRSVCDKSMTFQLHTTRRAWLFYYRFISSMWLHYLTTLFYMQLNYSLFCKPNQHPVDSRVDHLHVTAAVVVLVPAKVLTQHLHKGIFLKKPSGWQYWSLMTGDRGQAGTKLLPSVVNTASDMPQLNLKPMEKPIWRPAQGKGLDLETCLSSQLDQTNYISLLPSKIMRHLGYQKYKLLSGTFW